MSGLDLPRAIEVVDDALADAGPHVRIAWRIVRRAAERGRRISSVTLPRVAHLAQHAVPIRDDAARALAELDTLYPALEARHYPSLTRIRDGLSGCRAHAVAMLDALAAGSEGDPARPEEGRQG